MQSVERLVRATKFVKCALFCNASIAKVIDVIAMWKETPGVCDHDDRLSGFNGAQDCTLEYLVYCTRVNCEGVVNKNLIEY